MKKAFVLILVLFLVSISPAAFADTVTFPSGLTELGEAAFQGDTSLDVVEIPETEGGLTVIPANAFANSSLQEIHLPSTVVEIDDSAFSGTDPVMYVRSTAAYDWAIANNKKVMYELTWIDQSRTEDATVPYGTTGTWSFTAQNERDRWYWLGTRDVDSVSILDASGNEVYFFQKAWGGETGKMIRGAFWAVAGGEYAVTVTNTSYQSENSSFFIEKYEPSATHLNNDNIDAEAIAVPERVLNKYVFHAPDEGEYVISIDDRSKGQIWYESNGEFVACEGTSWIPEYDANSGEARFIVESYRADNLPSLSISSINALVWRTTSEKRTEDTSVPYGTTGTWSFTSQEQRDSWYWLGTRDVDSVSILDSSGNPVYFFQREWGGKTSKMIQGAFWAMAGKKYVVTVTNTSYQSENSSFFIQKYERSAMRLNDNNIDAEAIAVDERKLNNYTFLASVEGEYVISIDDRSKGQIWYESDGEFVACEGTSWTPEYDANGVRFIVESYYTDNLPSLSISSAS